MVGVYPSKNAPFAGLWTQSGVGGGGGGGAGVCPGVSLYLKLNGVHDGIYPAVYMIYVQKVCGERG